MKISRRMLNIMLLVSAAGIISSGIVQSAQADYGVAAGKLRESARPTKQSTNSRFSQKPNFFVTKFIIRPITWTMWKNVCYLPMLDIRLTIKNRTNQDSIILRHWRPIGCFRLSPLPVIIQNFVVVECHIQFIINWKPLCRFSVITSPGFPSESFAMNVLGSLFG